MLSRHFYRRDYGQATKRIVLTIEGIMAKTGDIKQFDWVWWGDEYLQVERVSKDGRKAKLIDPALPPEEYEWVGVSLLTKFTDNEYDQYINELYDDENEVFCDQCGRIVPINESVVVDVNVYCRDCDRQMNQQADDRSRYRSMSDYS